MRMGSYFQDEDDLNSGPPNTNPSCDREKDLNPGLTTLALLSLCHIYSAFCVTRARGNASKQIYDRV